MNFIWGAHHVAWYLYYIFEIGITPWNKSPENSVPLSYLIRTIHLSIYPFTHLSISRNLWSSFSLAKTASPLCFLRRWFPQKQPVCACVSRVRKSSCNQLNWSYRFGRRGSRGRFTGWIQARSSSELSLTALSLRLQLTLSKRMLIWSSFS